MADHKAPDYDLSDELVVDSPNQLKALFQETRLKIVDLLLERAATIKELSDALGQPKGTVGHHVGVLEEAGLIEVVRTKKIRAIEAKYYGRVGRTYLITSAAKGEGDFELSPGHFLRSALGEYEESARNEDLVGGEGWLSTLRYARIPSDRAHEWAERLAALAKEFTGEKRGGDVTYGMVLGMFPTDRPHLADDK